MQWRWESIDNISKLNKEEFNSLTSQSVAKTPFLDFEFLNALEQNKCVGERPEGHTGWSVAHLIIRDETDKLLAFIPAYIKNHSYGEYVFDHSWAHAYQRYGLSYYPKLVLAIPFTPVTGARVLTAKDLDENQLIRFIEQQKEEIARALRVHSIHILFPSEKLSQNLNANGFNQRCSVQFNWYNNKYSSFDDYLQELTARRRKSIKKERAGISKQSVTVKRLTGADIDRHSMDIFYECYKQTYLKRSGHEGYLKHSFFNQLLDKMPNNLLLVVAYKSSEDQQVHLPIAASLFLYDSQGLYGRYWGALDDISGLHFECCYYQGIEFCIDRKIPFFNPGTQGEHKILRGFKPTICYSNHLMMHKEFDKAVQDFLARETPHIMEYAEQSAQLLPFKEK